ncbi:binding-protein-dependent transport systems inner membrane component [Chloroherpeton thalassium ATCC 35110]|uniref:Binding-protein-dependent transport systems inner membrane component n=1 Tax=Chloroherpeton thalassium (strain ATCC 35110 / GB-78) TaxID=517418 RepID=B3QZ99_CHLT3|nr:ABC transporter permease [Chloroherpeton thalassium]ACF13792.1 binding-protein-dependent transport systems inner membrane component [Chloroherpeton thalassium ATCC 35110]
MFTFVTHRLLYAIVVIYGVMTITFFLMYILPGDPARLMLGQRADVQSIEAIRTELGLDKPLHEQYFAFLANAAQGNLGRSYATNRDVLETILERFPATALLAVSSLAISTVLGIAIGVLSAVKPYTWLDNLFMLFALLGMSAPGFFAGLLIAWVFGFLLGWFPISGYISEGWQHLVLPMTTLALRPLSINARLTRSAMLDVLSQDYVRTAFAKGVSFRSAIFRHALRNALNPVLTAVSSWLAGLLAGSFFIEFIFNWPGIGLLAIDAIQKLDFPMIQGVVLFTAVIFIIINIAVDMLYALLDPRVKLSVN